MSAGEDKAWKDLLATDWDDVCRRAPAEWDPAANAFRLLLFAWKVTVNPSERTISAEEEQAQNFLKRYRYFAPLSILHYLIRAQPAEPSGKLIEPGDLSTGQVYYQGSMLFPSTSSPRHTKRTQSAWPTAPPNWEPSPLAFGDLSFRLLPLPKLPVTLILWSADDEFPARADLLFDATCERHLDPDVLWAVAIMTVLFFL